jgi:enoyl-CoA hydratase
LPLEAALENEFRRGRATLASGEALAGAQRFAQGTGRHGEF